MLQHAQQFWHFISNIGIREDRQYEYKERVRIWLMNRMCFLVFVIQLVGLVEDFINHKIDGYFLWLLLVVTFSLLMLSYLGKHQTARYVLTFIYPLLMTILMVIYGAEVRAEYTYFVFMILAIIFHSSSLVRFFIIFYIISLYVVSRIYLSFYPAIRAEYVNAYDPIIVFIASALCIVSLIGFFFFANETNEKKLGELLIILEKRNDKLLEAYQEIESFAYLASHDLKTPLRSIASFSGLIKRDISQAKYENVADYLSYVINGTHQMDTLITDILDYSRLSKASNGNVVFVDIDEVIHQSMSQVQLLFPDKTFGIDVPKLPTILGNKTQLFQLFHNLLENAVKYNDNTLICIEINVEKQEKGYLFSVKDNGIGIAEEYHHYIFQMFKRLHTKDQYPGTGIGLAICKKVVEEHGGKIWVESAEGAGSCFWILLPDKKTDYEVDFPTVRSGIML
ncbi:MAG TPA: ATP-binding protein [Saprospiraceae bacterium]|nr:ATP-binding protein [Saprospiraceae bacterium]HMQ82639.1 ATP-binding protein [Saprospiraceae bacterium]